MSNGYQKPQESSSVYVVDEESGYGTQQEAVNFGPIGASMYEYKDRPQRDLCKCRIRIKN